MKTSWWKLAVFAVAVPALIAAAVWAERESERKSVLRRIAKLDEDAVGCDTEPWQAEREE